MSDAEIKRRKKAQGRISQTTGALGLASLGAFSASKIPGSKAAKLVPMARKINPKKAENIALGTSTAGAGIGGAGSFNFAAYTNAEGRKRKPVTKSAPSPFEDGMYGEQGDISKAAGGMPKINPLGSKGPRMQKPKSMKPPGAGGPQGGIPKPPKPGLIQQATSFIGANKAPLAAGAGAGAGISSTMNSMQRKPQQPTSMTQQPKPFGKSSAFGVVHD